MTKPSNKLILNDQTVAANEQRLRALVTATSDVIYSLSADWRVILKAQLLAGRTVDMGKIWPVTGCRNKQIR